MIHGQVSYQIWIKLPKEIRAKLVTMFHIPRTGSAVVDYGAEGNKVVSDGFTPKDIEAITLEKMQKVLDSDSTDFYGMLEEIIVNIDALMQQKVEVVETVTTYVETSTHIAKTPFCDSCDSKGVRHKKICPKNSTK
jgi:hypothetical protein